MRETQTKQERKERLMMARLAIGTEVVPRGGQDVGERKPLALLLQRQTDVGVLENTTAVPNSKATPP